MTAMIYRGSRRSRSFRPGDDGDRVDSPLEHGGAVDRHHHDDEDGGERAYPFGFEYIFPRRSAKVEACEPLAHALLVLGPNNEERHEESDEKVEEAQSHISVRPCVAA
jgi:hypothetical protein